MNTAKFTGWLTAILLISMQIASGIALARGSIDWKDYLSLWAPILTMAMGYWFAINKEATTK